MAELGRVEKQNLSQRVYVEIRNALMNGQYAPGSRLRIAELSELLGTSITPVREAIFRLASEQALDVTAATSIAVPELDLATVREIQLMRGLLEGAAAAQAARQITRKEIEHLEKIQEQFIKASATNPKDAARRNRDFHFELMAAARLPSLSAVVETMWVRMGPLLNTFHAKVPKRNIFNSNHPHYKVLEGLKAGDPEMASKAIQEDIRWGERVLTEWMNGRSVEEIYA
jgi:DNA-binding GntR family transcriptional regulator